MHYSRACIVSNFSKEFQTTKKLKSACVYINWDILSSSVEILFISSGNFPAFPPYTSMNIQPSSCRFSFPLSSFDCTILIDLTAEWLDDVDGGGVSPISTWFRKFWKFNWLDFLPELFRFLINLPIVRDHKTSCYNLCSMNSYWIFWGERHGQSRIERERFFGTYDLSMSRHEH